jgi:hypothetical protein
MNLTKWSEYNDNQRRAFMVAIQATTQARIMPPSRYVLIHANSKLSDADLKVIEDWVARKP